MLNLVLIEPEIPQNTGNIARTCAVTGSRLHLVGPMGFSIDNAKLKRAGLDYWHLLDITYYQSLAQYFEQNPDSEKWFASTKATNCYTEVRYNDDCHILFGKETAGLPTNLINENLNHSIRIPQVSEARSLNLSNAAAVICFEALRQLGFPAMQLRGEIKTEDLSI